jgi:adenine/guanine phosphoribosyltransferase-like PRPP-binding protein
MVLEAEDEYHDTARGIKCKDCIKVKGENGLSPRESGLSPREMNGLSVRESSPSPRGESGLSPREGRLSTRENGLSTRENGLSTRENVLSPRGGESSLSPRENGLSESSPRQANKEPSIPSPSPAEGASELDPLSIYGESFYRNRRPGSNRTYILDDRAFDKSNSTNSLDSWFSKPDSHSSDALSDAQSDIQSDGQSDIPSDTQSDMQSDTLSDALSDSGGFDTRLGDSRPQTTPPPSAPKLSGNEQSAPEDNGAFSSEFYRRSYFYRKTLSLDSVDAATPKSQPPQQLQPPQQPQQPQLPQQPSQPLYKPYLDRTPNPSPTATGLRPKRFGKFAKTYFDYDSSPSPAESNSIPHHEPKKFGDSFYKRPHNPSNNKHKKFDFEYFDKDNPPANETFQNTFPTADTPVKPSSRQNSTDNLYKYVDEQQFPDSMLDTSEDMRARRPTASGSRKPPPSMSIRVVVPMPVAFVKKSDPPPTTSPSPPLSLPSSPSPPPQLSTPSSPQVARGKGLSAFSNTSYPPVLTAPTTLSRSASPPLSLPDVPSKDTHAVAAAIRARIEEEVIRAVMDSVATGLSSTSDTAVSIASVAAGSSSSSLMARKRRLKQTHKEATLQRQLSLRKNLVLEVAAASGGVRLRKVTPSQGAKSSRQEILDTIRSFSIAWLRKVSTVETESTHTQHMKAIKGFWKSNKPLRQVVGKTTASQLLPTVTHLVWRGKNCFGVTMRDIQYLLRDPFASKDISSRLALRYRGTTSEESTQIGEVDCIVAIPHEAAISFASRLSICLRVPLQILQQRPCRASNSKSQQTTATFASGRGLYASGVETLQSRGGEEYELWLTQRHCIRPNHRCVVVDDVLDNGAPLVAAMKILRAAEARVIDLVAILEYQGFGGRDRISQTCQNIGLNPHPNVHACLMFNDNV